MEPFFSNSTICKYVGIGVSIGIAMIFLGSLIKPLLEVICYM